MRIDVYHHTVGLSGRSQEILDAIASLQRKADTMASDLTDLTAKVEENSAVDQSAIVLLEGLKAALDAAGTDPVALAALSQQLGDSSAALAAAVVANTPAEVPPAEESTP